MVSAKHPICAVCSGKLKVRAGGSLLTVRDSKTDNVLKPAPGGETALSTECESVHVLSVFLIDQKKRKMSLH